MATINRQASNNGGGDVAHYTSNSERNSGSVNKLSLV